MEKVPINRIRMGDIFSRGEDTGCYLYTFTGKKLKRGNATYPEVYCLDSGLVYCWNKPTQVYLQYREEEKIKEVNKVAPLYKVVHVNEEGGYESVFAGQPVETNRYLSSYPKLTYKMGEVTDAGGGQVRCWNTLEGAISHADGSIGWLIQEPTAILSIYPVGCVPEEDETAGTSKCQAVYVVEEVWKQLPEPKFKVGDRVRTTEINKGVSKGREGKIIRVTLEKGKHCYNLDIHGGAVTVAYLEEDKLELIPEERWEDVTQECTSYITPEGRVAINHDADARVLLGSKRAVISKASNGHIKDGDACLYKVELLDEVDGWAETGGFRVLRKVSG